MESLMLQMTCEQAVQVLVPRQHKQETFEWEFILPCAIYWQVEHVMGIVNIEDNKQKTRYVI